MVDELPQGALARYERDVAAIAHVISRRGAVPDQIQEGEEVLVPTFEIAAHPTVRMSEIKARRLIIYRGDVKFGYMLETPKTFGTILNGDIL